MATSYVHVEWQGKATAM